MFMKGREFIIMRKSTRQESRIVKRLLALFLIVLMSINTLGSVVSDNDGSAFITKAEFDSLKNNFQSQIDQYNASIDSKIDGAIASYLAGITVSKTELITSAVNKYEEKDRTFWNPGTDYDFSSRKTGTYTQESLGLFYCKIATSLGVGITEPQGMVRVTNYSMTDGNMRELSWNPNDFQFKVFYDEYKYGGVTYLTPHDGTAFRLTHHFTSTSYVVWVGPSTDALTMPTNTQWTATNDNRTPGSQVYSNQWSDFLSNAGNPKTYNAHWTTFGDQEPSEYEELNYIIASNNNILNKTYYGINYARRFEFDSDNLYSVNRKNTTTGYNGAGVRLMTYNADGEYGINQYRTGEDTFTFKYYQNKLYNSTVKNFINYSATTVSQEPVFKLDGLPMFSTTKAGKYSFKINLTTSDGECTVAIRNKKWYGSFPGTVKSDDDLFFKTNVSNGDLNVEFEDIESKKTYYLFVQPLNNGTTKAKTTVNSISEIKYEYE